MTELMTNPEFWKSVSLILWPITTLVIFLSGKGLIKNLFAKEQISIEVAGMKLSVADAAKNIGKDLADLQQKVALIEQASQESNTRSNETASSSPPLRLSTPAPTSIIWVDDYPSNNAFLVDRLQQDGVNIELSLCTSDALSKLKSRSYDAIISDLGRHEDGQSKPMAGLDLIKSVRNAGIDKPILIFAGKRGLENKSLLIESGADAVTASGTEVIKFVKDIQKRQIGKD